MLCAPVSNTRRKQEGEVAWFLAAHSDVRGLRRLGPRHERAQVRGCCQHELHRRELASEPGTLLVASRSVLS